MGFMDKAKKLAEEAQAKLDEVQKQFNEQQGSGSTPAPSGPAVEYDHHGRPVATDTEKPQGDPLSPHAAAPPAPADKSPKLPEEPGDQEKPQGDPLRDAAPKPPQPPAPGSGLTSGDPLAG
jgi:hypothetical protein